MKPGWRGDARPAGLDPGQAFADVMDTEGDIAQPFGGAAGGRQEQQIDQHHLVESVSELSQGHIQDKSGAEHQRPPPWRRRQGGQNLRLASRMVVGPGLAMAALTGPNTDAFSQEPHAPRASAGPHPSACSASKIIHIPSPPGGGAIDKVSNGHHLFPVMLGSHSG